MPYTIKPGSFKYKKSNGQFSEIDCFEGPDLTEEVAALEKGKAPIIIDSATGNPIAIKDGADGLPVEGMKIHFSPVQDLHGYNSPWPAGGGKNLVNIAPVKVTSQTTIGGAFSLKAGTYSFSLTAKNNTSIPGAMKITVNGSQVGTSGGIYANTTNRIKIQNITLDSDSDNVGIVISASTAGYDIDISDVQVETGSSSTDFAPYSNICPIEGWSGVTMWRTGKNLIPYPYKTASGTYNGVTYSINSDGTVNLHGTASQTLFIDAYGNNTTTVSRLATLKDIGFNAGDTITLLSNFSGRFLFQFNKADGTLTSPSAIYSDNGATVTATIPSNAVYGYICLRVANGVTINQDNVWFMIQKGSTASHYTPYAGQSYSVMFPVLGKNLCFGVMNKVISLTQDGVIVLDSPGTVLLFYCKKGESYTYSGVDNNRNLFAIFDSIPAVGSTTSVIKQNTGLANKTFVADKDGFGAFYVANSIIDTSMAQIELGSTATAYEPYKFIYKGILDPVSGILTISHVLWTKNTADMDNDATYPGWKNAGIRDIVGIEKGGAIQSITNIGNMFAVNTRNANDIVYLPLSEYGLTQDEWKVLAIDIQIIIPLETSQEIQLDPVTIKTLLGDNTIWSDANGDIELDYRADTKLFVDSNNPVTDVKINGSSIIENGIANIPKAGLGVLGTVKVASNYGLDMVSSSSSQTDGYIRVYPALDADIKNGGNGNYPFHRPITPYNQHKSVFYGLAKLAGADMSSSSNAIGTFTPEAIVAIQKMLGVYQAPWELIRQDSATNETSSDIEITVDGNGISLALTDLALQLTIPADSNTIISGYGMINLFYYTGADTYVPVMLNNFSGPKQHAWFGSVYANCVNGFVQASCSQYSESGNNRPVQVRNTFDFFPASSSAIIKIVIKNVQGTIDYKLYGRRKWTT